MIDYIIGRPTELAPAVTVVECGGIGYEIAITLADYPKLQSADTAKLYIHESIREDAHLLYGFIDRESREFFRLLIGVSGVGPNTARLILSSLSLQQLEESISSGDDTMLKVVKGIGAKTAQRIIVDLKDKIKTVGLADLGSLTGPGGAASENYQDALSALVTLGFPNLQSQKVLKKIFAGQPGLNAEEAIKQALKML